VEIQEEVKKEKSSEKDQEILIKTFQEEKEV